MATLTVRNLEDSIITNLKAAAAEHGRSMEAEARAILTASVAPSSLPRRGLASEIAGWFDGVDTSELTFARDPELPRENIVDE